MNGKSTKRLKSQRGIAMMVALLALLLLAAIGMGLMFMADTENSVNNNYRDSQKAYFAARAGAEQARLLIATDANINAQAFGLDGQMPSSGLKTGMIYLMNPTNGEAIDPTTGGVLNPSLANNPYMDDQLCWEQYTGMAPLAPGTGPCGSNNQAGQLLTTNSSFTNPTMPAPGSNLADALAFKWVRVTNKQNFMGPLAQKVSATAIDGSIATAGQQVCWNGSQEVVIPVGAACQGQTPVLMPVWELTSLAVTPKFGANPGSRRMVQMEVAFKPPLVPPAPISTQAPVALQGSFVLNAYDFCTCSCTTTGNGNNTVTTCNQPVSPSCKQNAHAIFTENTVSQIGTAGQTTTRYGTDPTGTASLQKQDPWPDNLNIDNLINQYKNQAGTQSPPYSSSCTGISNPLGIPPTYKNCGTQAGQVYGTYPDSLLGLNPVEPTNYTGGVTEYIPGSVQLTAGASGGGILIVDGDLDIHGGLNWYGLILVRGRVTFTGGAGDSTNMFGALLAGQDVTATDQAQQDGDKFGGSINFRYDICALNNSGKGNPPQLLATHEIMY
jgi:Tfp pilus assembly protein PilV